MEEWKTVVYKGITFNNYMVSNLGKVKSLNYNGTGKEKLLNPSINNGYLQVYLFHNKKQYTIKVHQLVATIFVDNPCPSCFDCVNHKDENKTNNRYDNLEWCDRAYNNNYGNHNKNIKETFINKYAKMVMGISKDKKSFLVFRSIEESAKAMGVTSQAISSSVNNRGDWYIKGYKWYNV